MIRASFCLLLIPWHLKSTQEIAAACVKASDGNRMERTTRAGPPRPAPADEPTM